MIGVRVALAVGVGGLVLASCSSGGGGETKSAGSCAAVLVYAGHTYVGYGVVKRDPPTTGRHFDAVYPPCNDTPDADEKAEPVEVAELSDVDADTAVYVGGSIFIREDREAPPIVSAWLRAPRCTSRGTVHLVGDWLGVNGPNHPRFDGDIRPPYRLAVHVISAPKQYVGATIQIHADEATTPGLTPDDVKSSLWKGGLLEVRAQCVAGHFRAISAQVPRRR